MLQVTLESEVTKVPLALKVLQVAMVIKAIREISGHLVTLGYLVIQVKMEPKGTPEKKANVAAMVREVNLGKRVASAQLAIQVCTVTLIHMRCHANNVGPFFQAPTVFFCHGD